jgi:hypothetical protein
MRNERSRPKKRGRPLGRPTKLSDQAQIARANRLTDAMSAVTRRSYALQFIDRYRDLARELGLAVTVRSIQQEGPVGDDSSEEQVDDRVATG